MPFLLLPALSSCGKERIEGPSFLFVSLDTTRADALGLYGYHRDTTPMLDELGKEGLVFTRAFTVSNNTLTSHVTMFTGLHPVTHGATPNGEGIALHENYPTLAEDFADAGYQTAGFTTHGDWLNERFGFHQGFDDFMCAYMTADEVLAEAKEWLDDRDPARPFFCFIHLFDVHSDWTARPYDAPEPFAGRYTSDYDGPLLPWDEQPVKATLFLYALLNKKIDITEKGVEYLRGQYDEGLAYTDDRLGRFLKSLNPLENTYIIITADHGEEFQEHGKVLHSSKYDEVVRIPLIIVPPSEARERLGAPRVVPEQVSTVDLRPTFLSLAGFPKPAGCQGTDLVPWLEGRAAYPSHPVFFEYRSAVRIDGFKLIQKRGGPELYDVRSDPEEKENLAARPDMRKMVRELKIIIKKQHAKDEELREAFLKSSKQVPVGRDKEMDERLKKLGYTR